LELHTPSQQTGPPHAPDPFEQLIVHFPPSAWQAICCLHESDRQLTCPFDVVSVRGPAHALGPVQLTLHVGEAQPTATAQLLVPLHEILQSAVPAH
jgi:hypothetical protein